MHRFFVICGLIMLWASQAESAAAQTSNRELLRLICDARNIKDSQCTRAKGYPEGKACNVDLQETRAEGRYLSAETTTLLVVYQSDCEAHATNNGGSLVFEKRGGGSFVFKGYQVGLVVNECTSILKGTRQDRLICTTGYMGQGHLETTVSEVVFTQDFSRDVKTSLDVLATASDDSGAYGANTVECKGTLKLFDLSSPKPGPAPDTVLVVASYADTNVIRKACAPGAKPPKEALGPAQLGEAYVDDGDILKGRFIIDLATRRIVREADFRG